ncbi:AAA family ATPase [Pseudanabaena galeata UHCC 0370]|uniref:AAA family ATPase n=1 Tax=Pseudanabaena galeata UHCC 0370 TaxID=3110310 RepID=A0ABU5TG68_9CYAN|nr:AAA family ATPase [Pseudanabaena galeata]MEA5477295.1 AAA family ATPase [Pseudanabaena galeata UHCC 0370]
MLINLNLKGIGSVSGNLDIDFGERLNILTGDNGLGKSFLLDVIWFALTDNWVGLPALPNFDQKDPPYIHFQASNGEKGESVFLFDKQKWQDFQRPQEDEIVIYSRINGGFSIFDPLRKFNSKEVYNFTSQQVLNGLILNDGSIPCMGLIHDLDYWQLKRSETPYQIIQSVIQHLSHPDEPMQVGASIRLSVDDSRQIPTLCLPYGNVPVTQVSSGIQRILSLAYMLVWAWDGHIQVAKLKRTEPLNKIVFLIDEMESHLHPKWQRTILPAILQVCKLLNPEIEVQVVTTTHSPMVLASAEPYFNEETDKLFLFELLGSEVTFREIPWVKQGDVVGWLTSEIFDLKQARSREAEAAIGAAQALATKNPDYVYPDNLQTLGEIQAELERVIPGHDPFWIGWTVKNEARQQ